MWNFLKSKRDSINSTRPDSKPERTGNQTGGGPARFLAPEVLSSINSLELLARAVVEGFISGLHRSPFTGFSTEFAEYRQYMPGDDLRHLDWKLLGRTDRYFIKKYRADTNVQCHFLLDASASMSYSSGSVSKFQYGKFLTAALAYLVSGQQDAVGLMVFDREIRQYVPAHNRTGHLRTIFGHLERSEASSETGLAHVLHQAAERITRRSIIVVISDFYDEPEAIINALQHLRFRGNDVIVFQVLDQNEINFDFRDPVLLKDVETEEMIHILPDLLVEGYRTTMQDHITRLRDGAARNNIDFDQMSTDRPLDAALFSFLAKRNR